MSRATVRVIKVGGSLLDWPDLPLRLWQWLQQQGRGANYLLAGGGVWADAIRDADARFALGEDASHELCLRSMDVTGRLLDRLLQQARAEYSQRFPDEQRSISVLDVSTLLATPEITARFGAPLPATWDATSDSIAALLAQAFGATELVLLKSTDLSGSLSLTDAAAEEVVDAYFPIAAAQSRKTRFVNLRNPRFDEWIVYPDPSCIVSMPSAAATAP
jgi:aspartokinase-like uncharacterized kinase